MSRPFTTESFIERAFAIHGDKFIYSSVGYVNMQMPVSIICREHGIFRQRPMQHLRGQGCPKCSGKNITTPEYIQRCEKIHGKKFDYRETIFTRMHDFITVICQIHGPWRVEANNHMRGIGCPKCSGKNKTTVDFINEATAIFGVGKFIYSKTTYIDSKTYVTIICPEHGEWLETPDNHLRGYGCPGCNESKGERAIRKFLVENDIPFKSQKTFPDCKYIGILSFDFYIMWGISFLIEFQGKQHFEPVRWTYSRCEEQMGNDFKLQKIKDSIKKEYCLANHIPLLCIPYWNIDKINDIIMEFRTQKCHL